MWTTLGMTCLSVYPIIWLVLTLCANYLLLHLKILSDRIVDKNLPVLLEKMKADGC